MDPYAVLGQFTGLSLDSHQHAPNGPKDAAHHHDEKTFDELFATKDNYPVDEDPYPYGDVIAIYRRNPEIMRRFFLKY